QEVSSLTAHPTRPAWMAGGGGLCLHTIVHDYSNPLRTWVGISAVGVLRTDDGGASWELKNKGLSYVPTGSEEKETLFCVHKIVQHRTQPSKLFMQFHGGVYASEDAGDTWQRREVGLPGNFGFPIVGLPDGTLLIAPLESEQTRYFKDGESTIYRSTDEAKSWQPTAPATGGGPVFAGVLRDAMATVGEAGAYFGTTSGQVATSADGGRTWQRIDITLPRVLCVRAIAS
ncbi:MAG: exo-alpha-sialidase, partial [Phycisphaerales bacterium]|nr:exo-alpha-sialidase [Phycisphaerales bacterium]